MQKFSYLLFFLFSTSYLAISQGLGEWVDYFPYKDGKKIAVSNEKAYAITENGLIEFDRDDQSVSRLSKINGMTDINPSCIEYNPSVNVFIVGYDNGNIDVLRGNEIINVSDIIRANIPANKGINNIYIYKEFAYLACGFGIAVFNLERLEFKDTYIIGINSSYVSVNDIVINNDTVYAATENGIKKAWIDDHEINYYTAWSNLPGVSTAISYDLIEFFDDRLYANAPHGAFTPDTLYYRENGQWYIATDFLGDYIRSIRAYGDSLVIAHSGFTGVYDKGMNLVYKIYNYGDSYPANPYDAILEPSGAVWVADGNEGMVYVPKPWNFVRAGLSSPPVSDVEKMLVYGNNLWVAAGSKRRSNYTNLYSNKGAYSKTSSGDWIWINKFNNPELKDVFDMVTLEIDRNDPSHVYFGSLGGGLIEIKGNDVLNIYNASNSPLNEAIDLPGWTGITGVAYDQDGNLWMANSRNSNALAVLTPDSAWYTFNLAPYIGGNITGELLVAQNGYKWMLLPVEGLGILVFDDGGTLDDPSDDRKRLLNGGPGTGGLPTPLVYSFAEDLDGEIWVGTEEGVAVFYSPGSVFEEGVNVDAQRPVIFADGVYKYLLEKHTVTAIAVDGANRKWFGTEGGGVFLFSSDGVDELAHFTKENSPLISNDIKDITINNITGEVYIGTDKGIVGYRGYAAGEESLRYETYAYPNPVPPDYEGLIAIRGVPENSEIRITDISGNLVFQTIAEGTQAVWNGKQMDGSRVATGVYLVFAIDTEGKSSVVSKILFLR